MSVFFISDLHINHANIIKYTNRPFADVQEMHVTLLKNWNKKVSRCSKVFVLGDFAMYGGQDFIKYFKGYKVLIMGNHDNKKTSKWWFNAGFDEVSRYPIIYDGFLCSHQPIYNSNFINIHGHTHDTTGITDTHYNVSVELHNYTPISYESIKKFYKR